MLAKEDESNQPHVVYYLSKGLIGVEFFYTYIDKFVLAVVHIV